MMISPPTLIRITPVFFSRLQIFPDQFLIALFVYPGR
jgi:hypothetical protein